MYRYKKRSKPMFGGELPNQVPLSKETDPQVKKLKKALEQLSIAPKPKYIKLFTNK